MRVRCNFCDARADSEAALKHTSGCPIGKSHSPKNLECVECGRVGSHAPRCPLVGKGKR